MSRDLKVLHLESTDVCQAACPGCSRKTDPLFNGLVKNHLTIGQITKCLDHRALTRLDKMFMCGIYGDPAAGRHTIDIYRFFRSINPNITLGMNSNGALQNTSWWQEIGQLFQQSRDYVVFSIDGLQDTNHIYRRGVSWDKLMTNVEAFIKTGASAHWDMLIYLHNEHQVQECELLAKKMGFRWFRAKVSKRKLTSSLQHPVGWQAPKIDSIKINCHALKEHSAYIDARGNFWPCCWIGGTTSDLTIDIQELERTWSTPTPNKTCAKICGTCQQQTNFTAQWQREIEL